MILQPARGTRDFLPDELAKRRYVENIVRNVFESYGFQEIATPIFEYFDLYAIRSGEKIREQMYVFEGKERERKRGVGVSPEYVLRPEWTAPVCRMFITSDLVRWPKPIRLYYFGQCFRYDRPGPGRYREFWHAGIELLGSSSPQADAEVIAIAERTLNALGLQKHMLRISNLEVLRGILKEHHVGVDSQNVLLGKLDKAAGNLAKVDAGEPLKAENGRRLDKASIIQLLDEDLRNIGVGGDLKEKVVMMMRLKGNANEVLERGKSLFEDSKKAADALATLEKVLGFLKAYGVENYTVDFSVCRGLDYYTGTVFEIDIPALSTQKQVCGGGRYDDLIEEFGGPRTPATGFALGFDRLVEAMIVEKVPFYERRRAGVVVAPTIELLNKEAIQIAERLRSNGIRTEVYISQKSLKKILSYADKTNIAYAIIVGPREWKEGKVILKNLTEKKQNPVTLEEIIQNLKAEQASKL